MVCVLGPCVLLYVSASVPRSVPMLVRVMRTRADADNRKVNIVGAAYTRGGSMHIDRGDCANIPTECKVD